MNSILRVPKESKKKTTISRQHPKVRHWLHFLCGGAGAVVMALCPSAGWSIIAVFFGYEAWEDFGYLHDGGFKDIWEFAIVYIPLLVVIKIGEVLL